MILAQVPLLPGVFGSSSVPVIAYCTVPGYPASPFATSLAGWWPASNALCSGVACSNGGSVTTVTDGSGNGRTMTVTAGTVTYNANALNGLPTLTFDANAYLSMASAIPDSGGLYSSYAVLKFPSLTFGISNTLFGTSTFGGYAWRSTNSPGTLQIQSENVTNVATGNSSTLSAGTWYQVNTTLQTHATYTFRVNRASNGSGSPANADVSPPNNFGSNQVGGTEKFVGVYADSFIYSALNNSTTVTYNECLIRGRYGSQF